MRARLRRHVRFEVAGDGNQDMVWVIEALSKETGSKQAARPKSQAPSPDPTTRPRSARANRRLHALVVGLMAKAFSRTRACG